MFDLHSFAKAFLEARAPAEHLAAALSRPFWGWASKGDGHAVIVLPGLGADDTATYPLRDFLNAGGFDARGWGGGVNYGDRASAVPSAVAALKEAHGRTGRGVSLVGWSLGGVYARAAANSRPDIVRSLVTLGAPSSSGVAPPVPTTSVISASDGIVHWRDAMIEPGSRRENILVDSSHMGIAAHPATLYAVADRLAQPEGAWSPFSRPGWLAYAYGDPERLRRSLGFAEAVQPA